MSLKIFGAEGAPVRNESAGSDIRGRFRAGYVAGNRPVSLGKFFVTTGEQEVAERIVSLLGVDRDDDANAEEIVNYGQDDNALGVFTDAESVDIIIPSPKALRQRMVLWVNGKLIHASDGEVITYPEEKAGQPSPQAGLTLQERKQAARDGLGEKPEVSLLFKLAADEELGTFRFQSASWDLVSDLAYFGTEEKLAEIDGPAKATLALKEVTFTAKSGPRKGKPVSYTKPVLKVHGPA